MSVTRTLCPLCDWHHDQADFDPTVPQPFASEPPPEGVDPLVWGYTLGRTLVVENALKAHLETHTLIEWVTALTTAQRRAEKAEARASELERRDAATHIADLIGLDHETMLAVAAVQDELLPQVHRYRSAWQSARKRAEATVERVRELHRPDGVPGLDGNAHCLVDHEPMPCPTIQALEQQ